MFSFISPQFLLLVFSPAAVIIYPDNTISERKVSCVVLFSVFAFFLSLAMFPVQCSVIQKT